MSAAGVDISPIPHTTDIVSSTDDPETGKFSLTGKVHAKWVNWLRELVGRINRTAQVLLKQPRLVEQGAAIGLTALAVGTLSEGLYRFTVYARITRPSTTSSSLGVILGWSDAGVSCTIAIPAVIGNLPTTVISESFTVRIQQGSPLTYQTTYASVGATSMQYALDIAVERL